MERSRIVRFAAVTAVVAVTAAVVAWWVLVRGDAPAAVSLEAAVAEVTDGQPSSTVARPESSPSSTVARPESSPSSTVARPESTPFDGDISGIWKVDTSLGSFDFDTASGSFVGFRVREVLTIGSTTAVGRTGDVTGTIDIVDDTLTEAEVTVDLTGITTDRAQRNRRVRSALETETFPEARFVLTEPVAVPAGSADGSAFAFDAVGDLTLHGVTRSVTFAMHAQLVGGVVVVVGSTDVVFDDYGVTAPSAPIVVSVEDHGVIELQLLFTR